MVGLCEHKIWDGTGLAEELLASEEGLWCLELVGWGGGCVVGW